MKVNPGEGRSTSVACPLRADANAGRVALVTGGGTGIGRATALALTGSGAAVVVCGRRAEPLHDTAAEIEAAGGRCLAMVADIREPDQGSPAEVAGLIAFLATAGGGYITGTTIAVDGGADAWGLGELPER